MSIHLAAARRDELIAELEMERFAKPTPLPDPPKVVTVADQMTLLRRMVELVSEGMKEK